MEKIEDTELFKLGTQVEITNNEKCYRNSWYKATIIPPPKSNNFFNKPRNNSLWVQYETIFLKDDASNKFQEFTDITLIRPLPPIPTKDNNKFEKFEFVDAYHKDGWFKGVLLDVFYSGFAYLVAFLNPYEEFLYGRDDIRVHMEWLGGGKWSKVYSSQKVEVAFCPPNVGETVVASLLESIPAVVSPEEHPPSPAKRLKRTTNGDAEERPSSDRNNVVQSVDAPQQFLQPCPFTSNKGNTYCNGKRKASDGGNYSSSFSPNNEDMKTNVDSQTRSPAKGNQVTEVIDLTDEPEEVVDGINEQVKVKEEQVGCGSEAPRSYSESAATECPKACTVTTCFSPQSEKILSWPFTKKSEMWKVYESMEVFKRIPQAPHFSPLNDHEENSREKLALCMMSNLYYEAERITAGSPGDLNTSRLILDSLKSLEELESHGFNITPLQDYLTELLFKIEKEKELNRDLEENESSIIKCQNEKAASERKVSELATQLKTLQEQFQSEKSVKDLKILQLADLNSDRRVKTRELHSFQLTMKPAFKW